MSIIHALLLGLGMLPAQVAPEADLSRLREMLQDRQHPQSQSQAALMLVQNRSPLAADIVRQGLRQQEATEVFLALTAALRLTRDGRFNDPLVAALFGDRPVIRQSAAETLTVLMDQELLRRLQTIVENGELDLALRQTVLRLLGRSGQKGAAEVLLELVSSPQEGLRRSAAAALAELTGQDLGEDAAGWRAWWQSHKDLSAEPWLQERLAYQASHAHRLEGEIERARAEIVRLHQQLYGRLPLADRLGQVQSLADHEDPAVRALGVGWCVELLPAADAVGQWALVETLLRFSRDGAIEVQRPAVLALGRVNDPRAWNRLLLLLKRGQPPVRAAAARALTQQASGSGPEQQVRQRQVVPALQQCLEDPALEVVVEAAEDLGILGVPEAGPVLTALLRHPSEPVRLTAAQAMERVADPAILDALLPALDDAAVTVRFSLVGALGHAAGDGRSLSEPLRARLISRLEDLLLRDVDAGVRSRAATVLGECGQPSVLMVLWQRVLAAEDNRVKEKAWAGLVAIITRCQNLELLAEWDHVLAQAQQGPRRLQLLGSVCESWKSGTPDARNLVARATELLVPAQLEQGKWAAALPLVRDLLNRASTDAELDRRLGWLLSVAKAALKDNNRAEAQRVVQDAQPFLARRQQWRVEFEQLERQGKVDNQAPSHNNDR